MAYFQAQGNHYNHGSQQLQLKIVLKNQGKNILLLQRLMMFSKVHLKTD